MSDKINRRDDTQALVWTDASPETDPLKDVRILDLKVRPHVGNMELWGRMTDNTWILLNSYPNLLNLPGQMTPTAHALGGDRHTGNLPISRVDNHDMQNTTHQQMLAIPLVFTF